MKPLMTVGRYEVYATIAKGGMGAVHLGRLLGAVGFGRIVAVKRMHPQLAAEPDLAGMFIDEAKVASRVQHPHVVGVVDVVLSGEELLVVMDYVRGESLSSLLKAEQRAGRAMPLRMAVTIVRHALHGLHAAHEARGADGRPLELVHRDMSPQNILVGADGMARVLDFGIAKSTQRMQSTREGHIKGKPAYMAPEQFAGQASRRTDVYGAGVVLWEALAGRRLLPENDLEVIAQLMTPDRVVPPPSLHNPEVSPALDAIVKRAIAADPEQRFASAREMALALEQTGEAASEAEIGAWVEVVAGAALAKRDAIVASIEQTGRSERPPPTSVPAPAKSHPVQEEATRVSTGATRVHEAQTPATSAPRALDPGVETSRAVSLPGAKVATRERSPAEAWASRSPVIILAAAVIFLAGAAVLAFTFRSPGPAATPSSASLPPASSLAPPASSLAPPASSLAPSASAPPAPSALAAPGSASASVAPRHAASAAPRAPGARTPARPAPDFL